jgi:hypothetical protein
MNINIPRWTFTSMAKFWSVKAATVGVNYFVEGVDEDEAGDFQNDSILFRMDGPIAFQGSAATNDEWYRVEMQILFTKIVSLTNDNAYEIYEWAGAPTGPRRRE